MKHKLKVRASAPVETAVLAYFHVKKLFLSHKHSCILLACMPKSGSTYLSSILAQMTGSGKYWPTYGSGRNEQELYLTSLIELYGKRSVCQLHVRATDANLHLINKFSIRPIVLTRNIFDLIVSMRDHIEREDERISMAYLSKEYFRLGGKEKLDLLVDLIGPWYINFYVSWFIAIRDQLVPSAIWLTYERLIGDPKHEVRKVADYLQYEIEDDTVEETLKGIDRSRIRYNKGRKGRGVEELTIEQQERIRRLCRHYTWVDFSRMGL